MDRKIFFNNIRPVLWKGALAQSQVDGVEAVLDAIERYDVSANDAAYILATAYWETGGAYEPVVENLTYTSAARIRAVWPTRFASNATAQPYVRKPEALAEKVYGMRADLGNTQVGDGYLYRGRGLPQLTGRGRYAFVGQQLGIDLVGNPDRMLDLEISATVLVRGLLGGWFTRKKLSDYDDLVNKRRAINGDVTANGAKIADIASDFRDALLEAGYNPKSGQTTPVPEVPVEDRKPVPAPSLPAGIRWGRVAIAVIGIIFVTWWLFF